MKQLILITLTIVLLSMAACDGTEPPTEPAEPDYYFAVHYSLETEILTVTAYDGDNVLVDIVDPAEITLSVNDEITYCKAGVIDVWVSGVGIAEIREGITGPPYLFIVDGTYNGEPITGRCSLE